MFGKLFNKKNSARSARVVEKPEQLQIGDMVELVDSFGLPILLRGQTLQVTQVNTYEFAHEKLPEFQLLGDTQTPIHLLVDNHEGKTSISFSLKISREKVEALFDMDAFSAVFDTEIYREPIRVTGNTDTLDRWMSESYYQNSGWVKGYFYENDLRNSQIPDHETRDAIPFETTTLTSDDGRHSVSIEVWEGGETDVSLELAVPTSEIKSFYAKT